jgi:hypothetical protein
VVSRTPSIRKVFPPSDRYAFPTFFISKKGAIEAATAWTERYGLKFNVYEVEANIVGKVNQATPSGTSRGA